MPTWCHSRSSRIHDVPIALSSRADPPGGEHAGHEGGNLGWLRWRERVIVSGAGTSTFQHLEIGIMVLQLHRVMCVMILGLLLAGGVHAENALTKRVPLRDVIGFYGFPKRRLNAVSAAMVSDYTTLRLARDSRRLDYNGTCLWLNDLATYQKKAWSIAVADRNLVLDPVLRMSHVLAAAPRAKIVVLDPGHGGYQPGAIAGTGALEKDLVLNVALRVRDQLRGSGITVHMTRTDDTARTLTERAAYARRVGADLFLSIHANFAANASAQGIESFAMTPPGFASTGSQRGTDKRYPGNTHDAASFSLAYLVHRGMMVQAAPSVDRGIKHARFVVLRDAPCPAALIECGFLSNRQETSRLATPSWRQKLANGISHGVLTYMSRSQRAWDAKK
jgi:N-acetylmuramoyl-L-alanine amidase